MRVARICLNLSRKEGLLLQPKTPFRFFHGKRGSGLPDSPSTNSTNRIKSRADQEYEDISKQVQKYKRQLRKYAYSSFKSREISSGVANLELTMADASRKRAEANTANTQANIPAFVTIEILSNGTTQMRPCVILRTPLKTYLFNCPEGTTRFLPSLRLRPPNIYDIFITKGVWDNIAGISSILLSKENNALATRIHGAMNVKSFLECIRPFQDADFGSIKYPSQLEERTLSTHDSYEDAAMRVDYIPLLGPPSLSTSGPSSLEASASEGPFLKRKNEIDVAFLLELKDPPPKIDPIKLLALKMPKGPWIGRLKAGETITFPDGRTIRPEDVLVESERKNEFRRALIVECDSENHVEALAKNSLLKKVAETTGLDYVVHLSRPEILSSSEYREWAVTMGRKCRHLIVNGSGPVIPAADSMFRHARVLEKLQPAIFGELRPKGWRGKVTQEPDLGGVEADSGWLLPAPLQRYWMRQAGGEEPIVLDLLANEEDVRAGEQSPVLAEIMEKRIASSQFPRVSFLGTSSAVPSKYRNVSSYLLELSESSAVLVDVGEGTYGQLRALLEEEETHKLLLKLHAIFITHAHQDHMNGLYTMIERRFEAFHKEGKTYKPLVLVCNKNVLKPLKTYSQCFMDLEKAVSIVDLATSSPAHGKGSPNRQRHSVLAAAATVSDLLPKMPSGEFDIERWAMQGARAVQIVFSGDTMPCDLLVEEGKGADLLIHESTFEDGHERDAQFKKHSTMGQAVNIAKRMQAKNVILSHFSARYPKVPPLPEYLEESGVGIAMDFMRVPFDCLHLVPKLIPVYRKLFHEELFEIELRKEQRRLRDEAREKQGRDGRREHEENGGSFGKKRKHVIEELQPPNEKRNKAAV